MRKNLALILIFIDMLGFSLIPPLLPSYAGTFAATPTAIGLLLGANAATQLIGAPIIGRLSDRYGLAFTVFQTVLSLFAQKRLGLDCPGRELRVHVRGAAARRHPRRRHRAT
jgi:MFS family permease